MPQNALFLIAIMWARVAIGAEQVSFGITEAIKKHVAASRPPITERAILEIAAPNADRLSGAFENQRNSIIDDIRIQVQPKTIEEQHERAEAQHQHHRIAMDNIHDHHFKSAGLAIPGPYSAFTYHRLDEKPVACSKNFRKPRRFTRQSAHG